MTLRKAESRSLPSSRKPRRKRGSTTRAPHPRRVALAEVKDDFSRYLKLASSEEIVITKHGRPAGVLIGFQTEDDWFEYRMENHPEFLKMIAEARREVAAGKVVSLEDVPD